MKFREVTQIQVARTASNSFVKWANEWMGENKIKRQSWDSNQIWMTIHSLLTGLHVGPLKQDSLIREQNSWGISNILQLINLYPSSLGMRCYLRCFWTLTLSVFYPLLCVPRKGNPPSYSRVSHRKPRYCWSCTHILIQVPPPWNRFHHIQMGTSNTSDDSKSKWN